MNALAVLEAVYDLESTDVCWLEQLAHRATASFRGAIGERMHAGAVPAEPCNWDHLLAGLWSVVRRRTDAGGIEYVVVRNPTAALRRLTQLERNVVQLATTGESNKHIAASLGVHDGTVSRTLARALRKLGLATRADLILLHAVLLR